MAPNAPNNSIQHCIKPSDTLQGICIQYGIKIDDLKRANKIWTNDGFKLKKFLIIPLELCKVDEIKNEENEDGPNSIVDDQNTKQKKRLPSDHSSQSFQEYFDNIDKEVESIKVNLKYDEIIQERPQSNLKSMESEYEYSQSNHDETDEGFGWSFQLPNFGDIGKIIENLQFTASERVLDEEKGEYKHVELKTFK